MDALMHGLSGRTGFILGLLLAACSGSLPHEPNAGPVVPESLAPLTGSELRYLAFQVFEGGPDPAIPFDRVMVYLAHSFNHGATLVNVFGWGIGGTMVTNNPYRVATEKPDALATYRRFLSQ